MTTNLAAFLYKLFWFLIETQEIMEPYRLALGSCFVDSAKGLLIGRSLWQKAICKIGLATKNKVAGRKDTQTSTSKIFISKWKEDVISALYNVNHVFCIFLHKCKSKNSDEYNVCKTALMEAHGPY
jgi:hypothetical protein